jgi:hypothetical protein
MEYNSQNIDITFVLRINQAAPNIAGLSHSPPLFRALTRIPTKKSWRA